MRLPAVGSIFEDRYQLQELLGEGGFARVYRAHDVSMSRDVALKVLSPTGGKYREITAARFMREVRMIAELQDPHTVTLYDFGQTTDGLLYMACEYIPGDDLRTLLVSSHKLPPKVVTHVVAQVLRSLREAHQRNITHRDIKPANILIYDYEGDPYRAKLVDFGLAKPTSVDATQITKKGFSAGTPRYMSPEQVLAVDVGPPSDIYSLGLVAYEMLTGAPAVDADDRKELLRKQVTGPPIVLPDDVPLVLRDVIERMLLRDLDHRYATADEVLADLHALPKHTVGPADVSEEAETRPHRPLQDRVSTEPDTTPRTSRLPAVIGFGTLAIVAFVIVAVVLPTPQEQSRRVELPPSVRAVPAASQLAAAPTREIESMPDVGVPDTAVPAADAPSVPVVGCGIARKLRSRHDIVFTSRGVKHRAHARLPATYDTTVEHPVMIMFRGRQMRPFYRPDDGSDFLTASGLQEPALAAGYVIVAVDPEDLGQPWQVPIDGDYVDALIGALDAFACIDDARLFVVGHDTGAAEAYRVACFRPVAALSIWHDLRTVGEERCTPRPAVPVLHFFGRKDRDVGAGERRSNCDPTSPVYMGHDAITAELRRRNECPARGGSRWAPEGLEQVGGSCRSPKCDDAPYVECTLEAGRQLPFPTNAGVRFCERKIPSFDLAAHTLAFFEQFRRARDR